MVKKLRCDCGVSVLERCRRVGLRGLGNVTIMTKLDAAINDKADGIRAPTMWLTQLFRHRTSVNQSPIDQINLRETVGCKRIVCEADPRHTFWVGRTSYGESRLIQVICKYCVGGEFIVFSFMGDWLPMFFWGNLPDTTGLLYADDRAGFKSASALSSL